MEKQASLKDRRAAVTREHILDSAFELLTSPDQPFSHEAVARRAGTGARTVYRYFPTQSDLFQSLWERLREQVPPNFPLHESDIADFAALQFERFDHNEALIRALLFSPAGTRVRDRGGPEGREAFAKSLSSVTRDCTRAERRLIVAVFVAVHSASFWQLLRDRGGLEGSQAQAAVRWTMEALLSALHAKKGK
jgi:AcrR family transcriptional regulator